MRKHAMELSYISLNYSRDCFVYSITYCRLKFYAAIVFYLRSRGAPVQHWIIQAN